MILTTIEGTSSARIVIIFGRNGVPRYGTGAYLSTLKIERY